MYTRWNLLVNMTSLTNYIQTQESAVAFLFIYIHGKDCTLGKAFGRRQYDNSAFLQEA